jgi:hypothetical protein
MKNVLHLKNDFLEICDVISFQKRLPSLYAVADRETYEEIDRKRSTIIIRSLTNTIKKLFINGHEKKFTSMLDEKKMVSSFINYISPPYIYPIVYSNFGIFKIEKIKIDFNLKVLTNPSVFTDAGWQRFANVTKLIISDYHQTLKELTLKVEEIDDFTEQNLPLMVLIKNRNQKEPQIAILKEVSDTEYILENDLKIELRIQKTKNLLDFETDCMDIDEEPGVFSEMSLDKKKDFYLFKSGWKFIFGKNLRILITLCHFFTPDLSFSEN